MHWSIVVGILGALSGFFFYVVAEDREFRQELTREEKILLAQGQTVTKIHKGSSAVFGKPDYRQGPLRVKPGRKGKPVFEPYGAWKQVRKNGELVADWTYTGIERENILRLYFPDGSPDALMYTVPTVLNGDSVRDTRFVHFVIGSPTDTLVVQHSFSKNGKEVKTPYNKWSYDTQGKRQVPENWKFSRF